MNHLDLNKLVLSAGSHAPNDKGQMCQMEAVAYFAHEPWSDRPQCASPVLCGLEALRAQEQGQIDEEISWRRGAALLLPSGECLLWTKPEIRSVAG